MSFDERLKSARRILEGVRGSLPLMWSRACEDWLGVREPGRTPWRVGATIPRNIYDADDHDIGRMDTAELAALVVVAVNADFETERLRLQRVNRTPPPVPDDDEADDYVDCVDPASATREWVQSRGFYEMLQRYRAAPTAEQSLVLGRFAHIQRRIVSHVRTQTRHAVEAAERLPRGQG